MMGVRLGLLGGTAILVSACGGQPAAPAATSAPPPTTAPAKPAGAANALAGAAATSAPAAAPAQPPAKPAAPAAAAVPAGWQTVKHPNADCQVAAPGNWQAMPEQAMAMLAEKASLGVGPSNPAEADALKASFKAQGGTFLVDTPTRWVAELVTPSATAYYIFWTTPAGGCFATLQTTAVGVQELGSTARQIAEAAGAGR